MHPFKIALGGVGGGLFSVHLKLSVCMRGEVLYLSLFGWVLDFALTGGQGVLVLCFSTGLFIVLPLDVLVVYC
jgi:hypothetical protein